MRLRSLASQRGSVPAATACSFRGKSLPHNLYKRMSGQNLPLNLYGPTPRRGNMISWSHGGSHLAANLRHPRV